MEIKKLPSFSDHSLSFIGPDLDVGPLPALFYFALAAQESLGKDPYNQPAAYLSSLPMRIFSMDVPHHGPGLSSETALIQWASEFARGKNIISHYVDTVCQTLDQLIQQNVLIPDKIAVAGLSRGAFLATHVAARYSPIQWILGFAPLTQVGLGKDFQEIKESPLLKELDLETLIPQLTSRKLRFYIGNLDHRVSTRSCFNFIENLSLTAQKHSIRSPSVELIISPSIGFQGHGTPKKIFHQGAQWIAEQLGAIDVV